MRHFIKLYFRRQYTHVVERRHSQMYAFGAKISEAPELDRHNYQPGGGTPLIDACLKSIKATGEYVSGLKKKPSVLMVIQTDGYENSSRHSRADLLSAIERKQDEGWEFLYLGAGIDCYADAASFGIDKGNTVSYGLDNSKEVFASTAANTVLYANSGGVTRAAYSAEQKLSAGDVFDPDAKGSSGATSSPKRLPVNSSVAGGYMWSSDADDIADEDLSFTK